MALADHVDDLETVPKADHFTTLTDAEEALIVAFSAAIFIQHLIKEALLLAMLIAHGRFPALQQSTAATGIERKRPSSLRSKLTPAG